MYNGRYITLELGAEYNIAWSNSGHGVRCRLIQTSPKGFNFLNEATDKCILKRAMFAKGMAYKPIPKDQKMFTFWITYNGPRHLVIIKK